MSNIAIRRSTHLHSGLLQRPTFFLDYSHPVFAASVLFLLFSRTSINIEIFRYPQERVLISK